MLLVCLGLGCQAKVQIKTPEPPKPEPVAKAEEPKPEPKKVEYIDIADRIQFRTGRAELLEPSKATLDAVAQTLSDHPEIALVEIEGHTDAVGSPENNLALSTRRAEAVRDYLVGKQVDEKRLTPRGYGDSQPVADNDTREGREQNRRVQFRVVERKQGS
jgi:outer membrane protein OmpA-like peptidoglycan-associated protein